MKKRFIPLLAVVILIIGAVAALKIAQNHKLKHPNELKTITISVKEKAVDKIKFYYGYKEYTINKAENAAGIAEAVQLINGKYEECDVFRGGLYVGSQTKIEFYDKDQSLICEYSIYQNADGIACIGIPFDENDPMSDYTLLKNIEDAKRLNEIIAGITKE